MPKVLRFHELGGPEVLKLDDLPSSEPGAGEVRLKVKALGLNRAESMFYHGQYLEQPQLPAKLGYEAAGVVDAVGPGVDKSWLGKQVSTIPAFTMTNYGVAGEEAIAPVTAVSEYPANLSAEEGTAIWMQYMTAYGALIDIGHVQKDDFVLITAASSSVGLAAIQFAKAEGAVAIAATRKSDKKKELLELGADQVIVTEEEDLVARVKEISGGKGARIIFDPVAGPFVDTLAQAASDRGILIEYGALAGQPTPFPLFAALSKGLTVRGYVLREVTANPDKLVAAKKYVIERLQDGRFQPKIAKTFPFAEIVDAYRYLESNAQVGKVVVTVP